MLNVISQPIVYPTWLKEYLIKSWDENLMYDIIAQTKRTQINNSLVLF